MSNIHPDSIMAMKKLGKVAIVAWVYENEEWVHRELTDEELNTFRVTGGRHAFKGENEKEKYYSKTECVGEIT